MTLQQLKYILDIAQCNSITKASEKLFISQPSLSASLKEVEKEIGFAIFTRNNRGLTLTAEGSDFLSYAQQVVLQYSLLEDCYLHKKNSKKRFGISTQHYSFAVKSFIQLLNSNDIECYDFSIKETKTHEVIDDVVQLRSEIGILYCNEFNRTILHKVFDEQELEFIPLLSCPIFVYLWTGNPLANQTCITMSDLDAIPCLSFQQENAFYFAEEVFSTYQYKKVIKVNDRATMLNLMKGLNGYTFCSGILSEELNGEEYKAVPFDTEEMMEIGYIKRKGIPLSHLAQSYLIEMKKLI